MQRIITSLVLIIFVTLSTIAKAEDVVSFDSNNINKNSKVFIEAMQQDSEKLNVSEDKKSTLNVVKNAEKDLKQVINAFNSVATNSNNNSLDSKNQLFLEVLQRAFASADFTPEDMDRADASLANYKFTTALENFFDDLEANPENFNKDDINAVKQIIFSSMKNISN